MFDQKTVLHLLNAFQHSPDFYFWKDSNHVYQMMNQSMAKSFGHKSHEVSFDCITDYHHLTKAVELADEFIKNDIKIMESASATTSLEIFFNSDNELRLHYVRKTPLVDENGTIIGVAGYIADSSSCPFIRSVYYMLPEIKEITRQNTKQKKQIVYQLKASYDQFNLSRRESEALYYVIRGKTAKETGRILNISYKTVEKYHENLKHKLDCTTRSQVIEKAIAAGAALIIPSSLLNI